MINDSRLAIVDRIYDSDTTEAPFGKRWAMEPGRFIVTAVLSIDRSTATVADAGVWIDHGG